MIWELKPYLKECWVIPPEQDGDFVDAMEDVLDVYERPYDAKRPVVCMDEQPLVEIIFIYVIDMGVLRNLTIAALKPSSKRVFLDVFS